MYVTIWDGWRRKLVSKYYCLKAEILFKTSLHPPVDSSKTRFLLLPRLQQICKKVVISHSFVQTALIQRHELRSQYGSLRKNKLIPGRREGPSPQTKHICPSSPCSTVFSLEKFPLQVRLGKWS